MANCVPEEPSASGVTRTFCAVSAARHSRPCARRSSPPSRRHSAASCRTGTGSTVERRSGKHSCPCRDCRCRCRCGSPTCCRAESPASIPVSWISSARQARSCGSAPASTGLPCSSARMHRHSAVRPLRRGPKTTHTTGSVQSSGAARSSGTTSSKRPGSSPRSRCPRSGISSGPAR